MNHLTAGVDIGSNTAKAVVLDEHDQMWTALIPSGTNPPVAGKEVLNKALEESHRLQTDLRFVIATGYGRVSAGFANKTVTEIACHGRGHTSLRPQSALLSTSEDKIPKR